MVRARSSRPESTPADATRIPRRTGRSRRSGRRAAARGRSTCRTRSSYRVAIPVRSARQSRGMTGIERIIFAATGEQAAAGGFGFADAMAGRLDQVDGALVQLRVRRDGGSVRSRSMHGAPAVILRESQIRPIHELRVAVTTADHDAAVAFYRDVAGLPQIAEWSSADGKVVVLDGGRATLELIDEAQAGLHRHGRSRAARRRADPSWRSRSTTRRPGRAHARERCRGCWGRVRSTRPGATVTFAWPHRPISSSRCSRS